MTCSILINCFSLGPGINFFLYDLRLPWIVNISETQEPGSVIHTFFFNCSCPPTLELYSVIPPSPFFNQPSLSGYYTQYLMTLSSAARLDARQVNHYQLNLKLTCMKETWTLPLSVEVFKAKGHPVCLDRFASPEPGAQRERNEQELALSKPQASRKRIVEKSSF
uniref:Uncharacterized protein n=1 Tax=Sarcophilus harrisii TaxID=9305 RepID=A0A7N4NPA9_SARHA